MKAQQLYLFCLHCGQSPCICNTPYALKQKELQNMFSGVSVFLLAYACYLETHGKDFVVERLKNILYKDSARITEDEFENELERIVDEYIEKCHVETLEAKVDDVADKLVEKLMPKVVEKLTPKPEKEKRIETLETIFATLGRPSEEEVADLMTKLQEGDTKDA